MADDINFCKKAYRTVLEVKNLYSPNMAGMFTIMKSAILNDAVLPAYKKHTEQFSAVILNELEKVETPVD